MLERQCIDLRLLEKEFRATIESRRRITSDNQPIRTYDVSPEHPVFGDCANGFGPKERPYFRLQRL